MSYNKKVMLKIDAQRAVEMIEAYLRTVMDQHGASGILIGLSGGIDSSVLAALAVRAVGSSRVHASYLYDRDSDLESEHGCRLLAKWLSLDLDIVNIEAGMRERKIYAPFIVRLTSLSAFLNRYLLLNFHRVLYRDNPFIARLRRGQSDAGTDHGFSYEASIDSIEAAFNARHIYRRELLEKRAEAHNWFVLGAANRSEYLTGWFVKDGVDDMPFSPLAGLYKTQVRQIAAYLGLPERIRNRIPSPDMMPGMTDELVMGISYDKMDLILDGLESMLPDEAIGARGVTRKEIDLVREFHRLSSWKRVSVHHDPPVFGTADGGFRIGNL